MSQIDMDTPTTLDDALIEIESLRADLSKCQSDLAEAGEDIESARRREDDALDRVYGLETELEDASSESKDLQTSVCCAVTDIRFLFNRIGYGVSQAEWDFVEREILPLIEPLDRL